MSFIYQKNPNLNQNLVKTKIPINQKRLTFNTGRENNGLLGLPFTLMSETFPSKEERTDKDLWLLAEFAEEREDDNNPAVSNRFPVTKAVGKRTKEAMIEAAEFQPSFSSHFLCVFSVKNIWAL